ncbi:MAG: acylphosphatase [Roseiarcus sp.]
MSAPATLSWRVRVEGYVQGVGFRAYARRAALRLGISGWVRNRTDGTVEALISGPPAAVEKMLAELRRGPLGAHVRHLQIAEVGDAEPTAAGFVMRATL